MKRMGLILPSFVSVTMVVIGMVTAVTAVGVVGAAKAGAAPVKEVLESQIGWEVNKTTKMAYTGPSKFATASSHPVKLVLAGHITGGFEYPEGVAVGPDGNIYVTDRGNNRVQELTPTGGFVLMFGWNVNKTKVDEGTSASQQEKNICTSVSKDTCQAGVEGTGPGEFGEPQSIAVDPVSGDVYMQDLINWRVDEYTTEGQFVLMIGREVNETTKGNICTVGVCAVFVDRLFIPGCTPGPGWGVRHTATAGVQGY